MKMEMETVHLNVSALIVAVGLAIFLVLIFLFAFQTGANHCFKVTVRAIARGIHYLRDITKRTAEIIYLCHIRPFPSHVKSSLARAAVVAGMTIMRVHEWIKEKF